MEQEHSAIPIRFSQLILLRRIAHRRLLADFPLYRGQPQLLRYIAHHPGCTQAELAERFLVSPASIAQSAKRLERAGLLEKRMDEENQRCRRLYVTAEGKEVTEGFHARLREADAAMLRGFEEQELETLDEYLRRILNNLAPMADVDPSALDPFVFFSLMQREEEQRKERSDA